MSIRALIAAFVIVIASVSGAYLHGKLTHRWTGMRAMDAQEWIDAIPEELGDWKSVEEIPLSPRVGEMLQARGYLHRKYINQKTGEVVTIAVVAGDHGPISVHVPEICYSSQNYKQDGERRRIEVNGSSGVDHNLWRVTFRTNDLHAAPLEVVYAWSDGLEWRAPENPRHAFAGVPTLFKIQLASALDGTNEKSAPCGDFLRELVRNAWQTPA